MSVMNTPIDWQKLMQELNVFMTQAEIGQAVGKTQAWVSSVSKGKFADVTWKDGHVLLDLHKSRIGNMAFMSHQADPVAKPEDV